MVFWFVLGLMTAAAIFVVVRPLLARAPAPAADADSDLAVYRDQLAEVDRDLARGGHQPQHEPKHHRRSRPAKRSWPRRQTMTRILPALTNIKNRLRWPPP
jgi:cytochrome c-type biogenesis protein CcmH/NrfG